MSGSRHAVHIIHTSSAGQDGRSIFHTSHIGKAEAYSQRKSKVTLGHQQPEMIYSFYPFIAVKLTKHSEVAKSLHDIANPS